MHYPVPECATLAEGDWVHRVPRALAALGVGLYNPIACPRATHVQLRSLQGNVVTLCAAKLRHRDTCRLTLPHTTPWHGHHGPHHPFHDNCDPWRAAVRECLNQCADEHLHYCRRELGPTEHPGWRNALVHLFHTTGTRDPRLRLSPKVPGSARLDDYRPIALGQLDMKLLTGPLTQRITEVLTRHGVVIDWQQGALPGCNTAPPPPVRGAATAPAGKAQLRLLL